MRGFDSRTEIRTAENSIWRMVYKISTKAIYPQVSLHTLYYEFQADIQPKISKSWDQSLGPADELIIKFKQIKIIDVSRSNRWSCV